MSWSSYGPQGSTWVSFGPRAGSWWSPSTVPSRCGCSATPWAPKGAGGQEALLSDNSTRSHLSASVLCLPAELLAHQAWEFWPTTLRKILSAGDSSAIRHIWHYESLVMKRRQFFIPLNTVHVPLGKLTFGSRRNRALRISEWTSPMSG